MAAATPPAAITVWALPSSDLQTSPTSAPATLAAIAARNPAPPAPMTRTSWGRTCGLIGAEKTIGSRLEVDRRVGDDPHRQEADIQVGQRDGDQARPRPAHVEEVHPGRTAPELVADLGAPAAREAVQVPTDQVAEGVTGQRIARQQEGVEEQDQRPQHDPPYHVEM